MTLIPRLPSVSHRSEDAPFADHLISWFKLLSFVTMIARLTPDGEERPDGTLHDMTAEDAVETLGGLIRTARHLTREE